MQRSNLCRESAVVALLLSLAGCGADPIQVEPAALASDNVAASTDPQGSGQVGLDGRASSDPGSDSGSGVSGDGAVGQGGAGGQDGASAGADPGGAAEPPPEGSGPEAPQPTRAGEPVLSLPSLPMGGDSADGSDGPQQCVQVSWLSSRVPPPGLRVRITGHAFSPDGPFSVGGSACAGRSPLCLSGFAFTANEIDNGRKSCYIPVQASGSGDPGSSVTLILSGEMPCPPSQLAACRTFELEVGNSSSQVSLSVPYPPETTAPEPTGPEPTAVKPTASTSAAASSSAADKPSADTAPADTSPAGDASSDSSPASSAAS